jgi:hypothetical protein
VTTDLIERQEAQVQAAQPSATPLLTALAAAASNPAADIDKMERLFAMHESMVKREAEMAFNSAFARAQAKMPTVAHNAANTQTNSKYAKLAAIVKAITPIYTTEGFSMSFDSGKADKEGYTRILARVMHAGGHSREYHYDLPPDDKGIKGSVNKTDLHAAGSTTSYGRRYLTCMIWNVTTEDDDDGNKGRKASMPEHEIADWKTTIADSADEKTVTVNWQHIAARCVELGDTDAYDALKSTVAARIKALKGAK